MGASASVPVPEPSTAVPTAAKPIPTSEGVDSPWPLSIQCLALALTRTPSLLEDPSLAVLLTKNALSPEDRRRLNEVETDDLFNIVIHSALESAFRSYMAKERNKVLGQDFGAQETERRLLAKECSRLEAECSS